MNRVAVLTPPGTGAIATLEVAGGQAWEIVRKIFRPANGKPLPESPVLHRTWFGTIGDEVILAVKQIEPEPVMEIHSHGGPQVVKWLLQQFEQSGAKPADERPREAIARARTLRAASILLDQSHGAFVRAVRDYLATDSPQILERLASLAPLGRHLVEPWKVVVAGAPNVGKSSLVNAIAGYRRSVVSPTAGTTRDVVTTFVALDGWPVELADTAGLRRAADSHEASGIELARRFLRGADLVVWLLDGGESNPVWPTEGEPLVAANKADRPLAFEAPTELPRVSAATGEGVPELIDAIVHRLVPVIPLPGEAVPYTPALANLVLSAANDPVHRKHLLAKCLVP